MRKTLPYIGKYMSKWLIVATFMGFGGGISAVALKQAIHLMEAGSLFLPLAFAPVVGGIILSIILLWDPIAAGFGSDHYIYEVNHDKKYLAGKTMLSKLFSTAVTLGFRGSGGVEGPMLVIGGSIGDIFSRIPILNRFYHKEDERILTICGAAGGIGAIFHSPLGGGIFVVEVLYKSSLHYGDLFPAILSSTMGFVIYGVFAESTPLFYAPSYSPDVMNVHWFILTGILAGVVSLLFMTSFGVIQKLFAKLPRRGIHPILGGILTGALLFYLPDVGGTGTHMIQRMINGSFPMAFLLLLLAGKVFATSFTVASGGSAGLVIPSLFLGAITGNLLSSVLVADAGLNASLVIAGMAASLASVANVPVAAAIMLIEMVGLQLGVPATLGSIVGYAIGHSRVIYGVTHPDQWQFEETIKWRSIDATSDCH
ncbi:chloride channel protein, CIC family [Tindallia magadiensis]|uniref:Chloride channel protein, CIC family n=1 Tax=Tindallia magadiensis TaxID=69895 RepID=A0A1I3GRI8_9FIRM|nr:chloride channel protein [Tindallia magadiensis]SFI26014.1 chloride channel protein, CIC family [Tindallia magadiensis]